MIDPISSNLSSPVRGTSLSGLSSLSSARPVAAAEESFSDMVASASRAALATVRQGEEVSMKGLVGAAGPQEVVEAVMNMETTLRTGISIRDKAVEAYQEILRMPI